MARVWIHRILMKMQRTNNLLLGNITIAETAFIVNRKIHIFFQTTYILWLHEYGVKFRLYQKLREVKDKIQLY